MSMPSTGFYSFLPRGEGRNNRDYSCQCPQRASTHFYNNNGALVNPAQCVNALNGLLLISTDGSLYVVYTNKKCQCPQRASTHFYEKAVIVETKKESVNALNGLLLISTSETKCIALYITCVNALNGLLLISTDGSLYVVYTNKKTCQCPQRASTHFYHENI